MAEEKLNIYQKLAKVRALADVTTKDKRGYNYTYADIVAILADVKAGLKKYGVSLIPRMVPDSMTIGQNVIQSTKVTKTGEVLNTMTTEMLFHSQYTFTWVNDDDPTESIEVPWFVTASMPDPAQAMGAGLTYALRQFLVNYFQIALTENGVDEYRTRQKEAEDMENRTIADGITDQVLTRINAHLESAPKDRDAIVAIVKKFAKDKGKSSSNPKVIHDPEVATKLLAAIEDFIFDKNG